MKRTLDFVFISEKPTYDEENKQTLYPLQIDPVAVSILNENLRIEDLVLIEDHIKTLKIPDETMVNLVNSLDPILKTEIVKDQLDRLYLWEIFDLIDYDCIDAILEEKCPTPEVLARKLLKALHGTDIDRLIETLNRERNQI